MTKPLEIVEADLSRLKDQQAVRSLTASYALDTMGNGGPLSSEVLDRLVPGLRDHPTTLIFLAYVHGDPVGLATCFRGFSTFSALPLVNIADLWVLPKCQGSGIGRQLLSAVERKARELNCCKVTLEVQENNSRARRLYETFGFAQAVYGDTTGGSLYYWKLL